MAADLRLRHLPFNASVDGSDRYQAARRPNSMVVVKS
jgi:hypothetical protein